ncbi:MAG: RNA polymerase factor sigma-32 [Micavibrio sp.]|nr:RNA polymerase factor sigma-32 [Micavibrio sp.]|tara:strand:- start:98365 stop:99240 length:876 start_codon:yes stop_codon:yes gene_type:complete
MTHKDDVNTQRNNLAYIRKAMNKDLLEKDEELELARKWRDEQDEQALHKLINAYGRLAIASASKFKHYGLPIGDLIQEGNIGLLQAAMRFDPDRNLRFSTYASWWIRSSMQDYVLRNWSIVRTGTTAAHKSLFFNMKRLRAQIDNASTEHGLTEDGRHKIAKEMNVRLADVEEMEKRLFGGDHSLNATLNTDASEEWQNFLPDERPDPEDVVIGMKDAETRSAWLNQALKSLTDREQQIIKERHLTFETVTLEALGNTLGISKERVRQLEQRAMSKLKGAIEKQVNPVALF